MAVFHVRVLVCSQGQGHVDRRKTSVLTPPNRQHKRYGKATGCKVLTGVPCCRWVTGRSRRRTSRAQQTDEGRKAVSQHLDVAGLIYLCFRQLTVIAKLQETEPLPAWLKVMVIRAVGVLVVRDRKVKDHLPCTAAAVPKLTGVDGDNCDTREAQDRPSTFSKLQGSPKTRTWADATRPTSTLVVAGVLAGKVDERVVRVTPPAPAPV